MEKRDRKLKRKRDQKRIQVKKEKKKAFEISFTNIKETNCSLGNTFLLVSLKRERLGFEVHSI